MLIGPVALLSQADLHDDSLRPLHLNHVEHILHSDWLKVQPAGGVIVGGHGLGVAVHHDRLKAVSPAGMHRNVQKHIG